MAQTAIVANNIALSKFNYFNEYVNAQLDVLEKDKRLKKMAGSLEVIENVRNTFQNSKILLERK